MIRKTALVMLLGAFIGGSAYAQGTGKPDAGKTDVQEVRAGNLAFRLQKCHHEASLITCEFTVTALNSDMRVSFFDSRSTRLSSRIVTYEGTEFLASAIQVANKDVTVSSGGSVSLVSGVVAKGEVSFNNVAQKPTKISLLKLRGNRFAEVDFRNIALQ